jgi:hypothetical protein
MELMQLADLDIDWSDPDTQIGALGAVLGLALGIGAPAFYASRDNRDEERLEELRALNRATKAETGEYLSQEELDAIRPPRWTGEPLFGGRRWGWVGGWGGVNIAAAGMTCTV